MAKVGPGDAGKYKGKGEGKQTGTPKKKPATSTEFKKPSGPGSKKGSCK